LRSDENSFWDMFTPVRVEHVSGRLTESAPHSIHLTGPRERADSKTPVETADEKASEILGLYQIGHRPMTIDGFPSVWAFDQKFHS